MYVEPSSSWVFERSIINEIGFWKHKSEIKRTPIVNYILRCWKQKVKIHFSANITCIACAFHHNITNQHAYAYEGQELEKLLAFFKHKKEIKEPYLTDKELPQQEKEMSKYKLYKFTNPKHWIMCLLVNDFFAKIYYYTSLDILEVIKKIGNSKNEMRLSELRTGEKNKIIKPKFSEALDIAKNNLK